jgi:HK97 family phage major capsid protein
MALPLMPEDVQKEIVQSAPEYSTIMRLAKRAPNMTRKQRRIPCLSAFPQAYFSNPGPINKDETEQWKQQTEVEWENKYLDAETLNCIIAIPEAVIEDSDYDIWGECRPLILEALGKLIDETIYYGVGAPAVWPTAIVPAAIAAGNFTILGSVIDPKTNTNDLYDDIMGVGGVISHVEEDGYMVNGHIAGMTMRSKLRHLRANTGNPIFKSLYKEGVQGSTVYSLDGSQMIFPRNGAVDASKALIICGDWTKLIYSIRTDVEWKLLDQAVLQNPVTKVIALNLPQQDMVGLRVRMRIAWQVPNPINRINEDEDTRYPFAVLLPAGS